MTKINAKVLITRPEKQGRLLVEKLADKGIKAFAQPLFDYQSCVEQAKVEKLLQSKDQPIVIFVSCAAVEYAHQALPLNEWQFSQIIAVGSATQALLDSFGINAICPVKHNSEGVLALPQLQQVLNTDIVIVRGNGGRELIAEQLTAKGANVVYLESYQRVWRQIPNEQITTWHNLGVNCIVVTSIALLEYTLQLVENRESYWKTSCLWIVASDRIAEHANQAKISHIVNAHGASDEAIMAAISQHGII